MVAETKLGTRQYALLREALRRYSQFHKGKPMTEAWTGLGVASVYAPVVRAGYMELVHEPNRGYDSWWRLTPKGATIVQAWLDAGDDHHTVEAT